MAEPVYLLCALTSTACAVMLLRSYRRNRVRLLFWSTFCFAGLALNNAILFVDLVLVPHVDLMVPRSLVAIAGLGTLVVSFIWEDGR